MRKTTVSSKKSVQPISKPPVDTFDIREMNAAAKLDLTDLGLLRNVPTDFPDG